MPRWTQLLGGALWLIVVIGVWSNHGPAWGLVVAVVLAPLLKLAFLLLLGLRNAVVLGPGWQSFVNAWEEELGDPRRRAQDIDDFEANLIHAAFQVWRRDRRQPARPWIREHASAFRAALTWLRADHPLIASMMLGYEMSGLPHLMAHAELLGLMSTQARLVGVAFASDDGLDVVGRWRSLAGGEEIPWDEESREFFPWTGFTEAVKKDAETLTLRPESGASALAAVIRTPKPAEWTALLKSKGIPLSADEEAESPQG